MWDTSMSRFGKWPSPILSRSQHMALARSLTAGEACDKEHGSSSPVLHAIQLWREVMIASTRAKAITRQEFTRAGQCVFFLDGIFMQF